MGLTTLASSPHLTLSRFLTPSPVSLPSPLSPCRPSPLPCPSGLLPPLEEGKPAAQGGEPAETWPASGRNAPPVRALDPARIKVVRHLDRWMISAKRRLQSAARVRQRGERGVLVSRLYPSLPSPPLTHTRRRRPCARGPVLPQRLTRRMASAKAVRRAMSGALHSMSSQIFLAGAHAARAPLAVAARAYRLAASGARLSLSSHCQHRGALCLLHPSSDSTRCCCCLRMSPKMALPDPGFHPWLRHQQARSSLTPTTHPRGPKTTRPAGRTPLRSGRSTPRKSKWCAA